MIAIPSILLISLLAMLSIIGAATLSTPWMRLVALGFAAWETAMVIFLLVLSL
jgi:hypothetical protein